MSKNDQTNLDDALLRAARIDAQAQQFSTYVQMTEALTDRQASVIRYYISLHTALIAAGGAALVSAFSVTDIGPSIYLFAFVLLLCVTGGYFCRIWSKTLKTLRYWEDAKYTIIRNVEERQPDFLRLYSEEWRADGDRAFETKRYARDRVLALPSIFAFFYWSVALIIACALIVQVDAQFFDAQLLEHIDGYVPGVRNLLDGSRAPTRG